MRKKQRNQQERVLTNRRDDAPYMQKFRGLILIEARQLVPLLPVCDLGEMPRNQNTECNNEPVRSSQSDLPSRDEAERRRIQFTSKNLANDIATFSWRDLRDIAALAYR